MTRQYDAQQVIERIAAVSTAIGQQAGVGAMETAGAIIGYLAENPRDLEPFMVGGWPELPDDWHQRHSLTWMAKNGQVVHPATARRSRIINNLKREQP